jgi:cell division protein FtsW
MYRKSVYFLVMAVIAMLVIGIVMLFSTSAFAKDAHGDPVYFVKRQSMWLAVGLVVCITASLVDYHFWQRTWHVWFVVAAVLLALCFVPHIGLKINGARRWVGVGPLRFQPSDFAKIASLAFLAWWFSKYEKESKELLKGFVYPFAIVGILMALIAREIDMGTTALICCTMLVVMFVAGTSLRYLMSLAVIGLSGTIYIGSHLKGRSERILAFWDLEKYKDSAGLQQYQALIAFGSGGVDGLGLGNGRQKMLYLPFAHTDFIFPMIGEELGLRFTLLLVFCYIVIIACGTAISVRARDRFGMLLGFGVCTIIALQAALNIGVTTALLPNKGLPLPFISYGGSNLVFCLLCVGILINIYRQGIGEKTLDKTTSKLRVRTTPRI